MLHATGIIWKTQELLSLFFFKSTHLVFEELTLDSALVFVLETFQFDALM